MTPSILTTILTIIYTLLILFLTARLLSYDFIINKIIYLGVALTPIFLIIIISLQEYWLILGIIAVIPTSKIPLPLLDALSFNYVINAGILILIIAEITIKKKIDRKIFTQFPSKAMAIFFLWCLARFIYDKPGAGSVGTAGGLSSALPTVLAGACYFSILNLSIKTKIREQHIKFLFIGILIGIVEVIYKNIFYFIPKGFISLFSYPAIWFLALLTITKPLEKAKTTIFKNEVMLISGSILIILSSVLSLNRLPFVYAAISLGLAYYLYNVFNKYIRILIPAFIVIFSIVLFTPDIIPKAAIRTLSLITPSYMIDKSISQEVGEIGWESDWRTQLSKIAWYDMMQNPLLGKGLSFSQSELYYNAVIATTGDAARFGGLLSSGGYHNSLLFMAVKLGIPITILFIAILLNIYIRFFIFTKIMDNTLLKRFSVMLACVFVCMVGKMLTNGGPLDIFNISILLGVMQGMMLQKPTEQDEKTADDKQYESLADSLMLKHIERKNQSNNYKR